MLEEKFIQHIRNEQLFNKSDILLLAVSGGVDSVVLCELCFRAGLQFKVAHANFQLRGNDSIADEIFVKGMGDKYNVPVFVKQFDTSSYAQANKLSVQVAARELRYSWFQELLKEHHCRLIVTAHHADDNIETILMNFFRGTGISGLRGILPLNEKLVRPLLPFTKSELIQYAHDHRLTWREDSSNASDKYSRNYFRNTFIPFVKEVYPEAVSNLLNNIARFRDIEILYQQAIAIHKNNLMEYKANEIHVPVLKLKKSAPLQTILYEIIKDFGFHASQLNDVQSLLEAEQGKFVRSDTHRIIRNRNWLIISPIDSVRATNIIIEEHEKLVAFESGTMVLAKYNLNNHSISASALIAELDTRLICFPLILRKWKAGDYFYPLGMQKKKKIARFLIDLRLSPPDKEKVWVVESNKRICWVGGYRIDDRFKITDKTKEILRLELNKV